MTTTRELLSPQKEGSALSAPEAGATTRDLLGGGPALEAPKAPTVQPEAPPTAPIKADGTMVPIDGRISTGLPEGFDPADPFGRAAQDVVPEEAAAPEEPEYTRARDRDFSAPPPELSPEESRKARNHEAVLELTRQAVGKFDSEFTAAQRASNRLGTGDLRKQQNNMLRSVGEIKNELLGIAEGDEEVLRRVRTQLRGNSLLATPEEMDAKLAEYVAMRKAELIQQNAEFAAIQSSLLDPQVENREGELVSLPTYPAMQALAAAQQAGDTELVNKLLGEFYPGVAAETALTSIAQMGPAAVLVPGGGALTARLLGAGSKTVAGAFVAGTGLVSGDVEYNASFTEFMQENGVDLSDINSVEKALDDPALVRKARTFAAKRGVGVALWDMVGAFGATKMLVPPKLKNRFARQLVQAFSQLVVQGGSGAAGEGTAQVFAGQETNTLDMKLEAFGELPSAVLEPAVYVLAREAGLAPQEILTHEQVIDAYLRNEQVNYETALNALIELSQTGMSLEQAKHLLTTVPGNVLPFTEAETNKVLDNTHTELNRYGDAFKSIVQDSAFEGSDGQIYQGSEILDRDSETGNLYWSNGEFTTADPGGETQTLGATSSESATQDLATIVSERQFELEVAQAQGADSTAINMLSNELEAAKEAQAQFAREEAAMAAIRPQLKALIRRMQETFLPGTDIMVVEDHLLTRKPNKEYGSAGALFSNTTGRRTQVLYINPDNFEITAVDPRTADREGTMAAGVVATIGHEFGHAIMQKLTASLPAPVLEALHREHRKWVASQLKDDPVTIQELMASKKNIGAVNVSDIDVPLAAETFAIDSKRRDYLLSFQEWIADAVSKQTQGQSGVLPEMTRKVAPRIASILDSFVKRFGNNLTPDVTTPQFLEFLKARAAIDRVNTYKNSLTEEQKGARDATMNQYLPEMFETLDIPPEVRREISADLDKYNRIMRWSATLLQLGKANPHVKGLQDYIRAVHEHWVTKSTWNDEAMQTINAWRKLGRKTSDAVGRFLLERTVQSDELKRKMTISEQEQLYRQMGEPFGAKKDAAFEVIQKVDADFARALDSLYAIEASRVNKDYRDTESLRKGKMAELDKLFYDLRNRNYFPLSRFGTWGVAMKAKEAVTVRGRSYAKGETAAMELYENKKQRNKGLGKLQREFGPAFQHEPFKVDETMEPFTGLPLSIMRSLKDNPKLGLDETQKKKMLEMIETLSPTQSIAKRMLNRKGTAGFSMDAQRAYGNYMMQIGGHLAKIQHVGQMDAAIQSIRKSANYLGSRGINNDKRYEIAEHASRHQQYIMNPVNELGGLRALAFVWFLGYNVKSALVNLTQIPLVAYPYLAARKELTGGLPGKSDAIAIAELTKAMKDVSKMYQLGGQNISQQENDIMEILTAEGIIDESLATELAGVAHGDLAQKMMPRETAFTDSVHHGATQFLRGSTWMFQAAEKFNRRAVAIATVRLAQKQGMDATQQLDEAREALRTTQFEYARWNRAAFMRGKAGVLFVFMQYMQNILSFTVQDPGRTRYMLMLLMAAGLQGLPGAEDLLDLYDFVNRNVKKGKLSWMGIGRAEKDPRSDIRESLRELIMTLHASPELIMHGLSAQSFGLGTTAVGDMLGTQLPSLTFEGSISMGRLIPGWESLMSGRPVGAETAKDVAGAAITIPMNILEWTRDEDPVSLRAFERTTPSALKGAIRAWRLWNDEKLTDRSGNTLIDFDMNNPAHIGELIGMGLGASPTRLAREQERRWAVKEALMYYASMRQNIQADYNYAQEEMRATGDKEVLKPVMETIHWFNRNAPKGQGLYNFADSYVQWKMNIAKDAAGVSNRLFDVPLEREINKTFPAAEVERIR